jgi:hypothetical protein
MAGTSPTPQESLTGLGPQAGDASKLTGLLRAEHTCPVCSAVVVRIEGNNLQYLKSHMHLYEDKDGYVSLIMYHPKEGESYVPPKELERPFLTIQFSVMTS